MRKSPLELEVYLHNWAFLLRPVRRMHPGLVLSGSHSRPAPLVKSRIYMGLGAWHGNPLQLLSEANQESAPSHTVCSYLMFSTFSLHMSSVFSSAAEYRSLGRSLAVLRSLHNLFFGMCQ